MTKDFWKSFFLAFAITFCTAWTIYNVAEYNRSFDNCERLLAEIKAKQAILEQEINDFEIAVYGQNTDF